MEARVGIEPTDEAFAEPCLTTWLPRHQRMLKINFFRITSKFNRGSICRAQLAPVFPQLLRLENSHGRDDAGDELRRRHVEPRIARGTGGICHPHIGPPVGFRISDSRFRV
jgi:hypothetical protein